MLTNVDACIPCKPDLDDFWRLESIGISDPVSSSADEIALKQFEETLSFEDGRYNVTWPWKTDQYILPAKKGLAVGRLKSLLSKLTDKPELIRKYSDIIPDQLENGIIERVTPTQSVGKRHYIPHHAVVKDDKATTKVRIVYDASANSKRTTKVSMRVCIEVPYFFRICVGCSCVKGFTKFVL